MIRRPPRSTLDRSSAASDVYKRQRLTRVFLVIALTLFSSLGSAQQKQRVIFQVSDADPAKWNLALNNAKNVQEDLGKDNVQIEIVAYGPGLAMLKADSKVADRLAGALD